MLRPPKLNWRLFDQFLTANIVGCLRPLSSRGGLLSLMKPIATILSISFATVFLVAAGCDSGLAVAGFQNINANQSTKVCLGVKENQATQIAAGKLRHVLLVESDPARNPLSYIRVTLLSNDATTRIEFYGEHDSSAENKILRSYLPNVGTDVPDRVCFTLTYVTSGDDGAKIKLELQEPFQE